jgi:hypothetical protein
MDELHRAYAERAVQSIFLYVREAHPGENYGPHDTFDRKLHHAREFQRVFMVERPILVDDLEGTAHRAFGQLPNMTYILNSSHTIVFRSAWTDAATVRLALDYLLDVQARRREGARLAPFYSELLGFRWIDDAGFREGLARNGARAVSEYAEATERWAMEKLRGDDVKPT